MRMAEYLGISGRREGEVSRGVRAVATAGLLALVVAICAILTTDLSTMVQIGLIVAVAVGAGACVGAATVAVDRRGSRARKG